MNFLDHVAVVRDAQDEVEARQYFIVEFSHFAWTGPGERYRPEVPYAKSELVQVPEQSDGSLYSAGREPCVCNVQPPHVGHTAITSKTLLRYTKTSSSRIRLTRDVT